MGEKRASKNYSLCWLFFISQGKKNTQKTSNTKDGAKLVLSLVSKKHFVFLVIFKILTVISFSLLACAISVNLLLNMRSEQDCKEFKIISKDHC